ncbi:MAG: hypothetical protein Q8T09_12915 [Candidatus Melainabacteria bacterium]|nr:hypothetical protein [Candidatus Melainabacteria bacterium]
MFNDGLACVANILMSMLGPACCTILTGVGPVTSGLRDEKLRDPECDKVFEPDQCQDD